MIAESPVTRFSVFVVIIMILTLAELYFPARQRIASRRLRWVPNFSLGLLSSILLYIISPLSAVATAVYVETHNLGLMNLFQAPPIIAIVSGVLLLDLAIYFQHYLTHKVPILWRLHRVHHADKEIDLSTGLRFHPIEIVLSLFFKILIILSLGIPFFAVVIFEILLNTASMFNHSNIKVSPFADRILRWIIVTPKMHLVHHSEIQTETDSNFSTLFSFWDRIFNTYREKPELGHDNILLGLTQYRDVNTTSLSWLLKEPFTLKRK